MVQINIIGGEWIPMAILHQCANDNDHWMSRSLHAQLQIVNQSAVGQIPKLKRLLPTLKYVVFVVCKITELKVMTSFPTMN